MQSNFIKEHQVLILMLLLALGFGLVFVFLVPPWQHYDEPTQFEYAWLIADRPGLPGNGEYDQSMRREVAASMIEHGFFQDLGFEPNLLSASEQIWIGISQIGSKPLYYWVAALPLRLLSSTDVAYQLYAVRLLSLFFYLVTITAAYGFAVELTPAKHPLRWLLPLSILLIPSFVDILTAVNDDVGSTALFSLFLWSGVRLIKRGVNLTRILVFLLLTGLCFYTKNTVMIAVLLAVIPLLFSIIRGKKQHYVWIGLTVGVLISLVSLLDYGSPKNWYPEVGSGSTKRVIDKQSPVGKYVIAFHLTEDLSKSRVSQLIPSNETDQVGRTLYTVGAWIWADQPIAVLTPTLHLSERNVFKRVNVDQEPRFFSFTEKIGAAARPYKISLYPDPNAVDEPVTIYYDGIIFTEGDWEGEIPRMDDASGRSGLWNGREFTNQVRNSSVELPGLTLRNWIESAFLKLVPGNPVLIIGLIQDPSPLISYYSLSVKSLFHTFWAKFGWGHVFLVGYRPYSILGLFTMAGVVGGVIAFWRHRKQIQWDLFLFLGLSVIIIWGSALLRGLTSQMDGGYFIPVARYAYPAIIPTMLILNIGWLEIIRWIEHYFKIRQKYQYWLLIALFILLDVFSIYSIYTFYLD